MAGARRLYTNAPPLVRLKQRMRELVCPMQEIVQRVPAGARVLDIGCGAGLLLGLLGTSGRRVDGVGVDCPVLVRIAQAMAEGTAMPGSSLKFVEGDVTLDLGTFDVVCLVDVLHHIPVARQESSFVRACDQVGPGGLLVYKDMCARPRHRAFMNFLHDLLFARQFVHHVPVRRVEGWAAGLGLELVESAGFSRLWYGHELRVFRRAAGAAGTR